MDQLEWLQEYYLSCCDGDWEHTYGIKIDTLDNPGWMIKIDLEDTVLESIPFQELKWDTNELDWGHCEVKDNIFQGHGGAKSLTELISIFRKWVKKNA